MLPKNRRIERKYFTSLLSHSKKYHSPHFLLFLASQDSKESQSKFSFSVSKKVAKRAIKRNLCRRRGYAVILKHLKEIKPGFFLFFSFKKFPDTDFKNLETEILNLLRSTSVLI